MSLVLGPHVSDRTSQILNAERPKVVPVGPPQVGARHETISICDSRARPLQTLNEPRDVRTGRKLDDQVHMVPDDSDLDNSCPVAAGDSGQGTAQERRRALMNERETAERRPRQ